MGYRIFYDSSDYRKPTVKRSRLDISLLTSLFFIIFLLLVKAYWLEGNTVIMKLLWPGEMEVLNQAVQYCLAAMENGQAFSETIRTFCTEILHGTQFVG